MVVAPAPYIHTTAVQLCSQSTKQNLEPFEFVVISDFAENFTFVMQDEVQAFLGAGSNAHFTRSMHITRMTVKNYEQYASLWLGRDWHIIYFPFTCFKLLTL